MGSYSDVEDFMSSNGNGRDLVPQTPSRSVQRQELIAAGQAANRTAADYMFADYRQRRAASTLRTQRAALVLWVLYLAEINAAGELLAEAEGWALACLGDEELDALAGYAASRQSSLPTIYGATYCQSVPAAWQGITWGLVEGFVKWLLNQGYTVASANNRLSAVRVYVRLAVKAGIISPEEHALIREVRGYGQTEGKRVDERRAKSRIGHKKEEALVLTAEQARLLKTRHALTPQGIRDRLLMCLLLDLGLRSGEAAAQRVEDFVEPGYVCVFR
jgi:integrase